MSHLWIFDVLLDLQAYALQNGLPELALKVEEVLAVARREIEGQESDTRPRPASVIRKTH